MRRENIGPRRRLVGGRPIGPVEAEVLDRLWKAGRPLGVREVAAGLRGETRAYTTVVTMLTRLTEKGLVRRCPAGQTFLYEAAGSPDELAAAAMRDVLHAARQPQAVLACFVHQLAEERVLLRRLAEVVEQEAARGRAIGRARGRATQRAFPGVS